MFILGNLIFALAYIIQIILWLYFWLLFARAVLSWFDPNPYSSSRFRPKMSSGMRNAYITLKGFLIMFTEPLLKPIRKRIRIPGVPIDVAFIVLILVIIFLQAFLPRTLFDIASRLR
ncbi:YggT family protein [Acidobacteriota bacterium]